MTLARAETLTENATEDFVDDYLSAQSGGWPLSNRDTLRIMINKLTQLAMEEE